MDLLNGINILAVIIAALAYFVIGFFWFSPFIFGEYWKKETGAAVGLFPLVGDLVAAVCFSFGLAIILKLLGNSGIVTGVGASLIVIICFILPFNLLTWTFKKKLKVFLIEGGFQAFGGLVMGIILSLWK